MTIDELFQQAIQAHLRGDRSGAERQYWDILARQPDHAATLTNLGLLLADRGDTAGAIACHEHAIHVEPDVWTTHYNLGQAYRAARRWDEATASYGRALTLEPTADIAALGLSLAHMALDRTDAAMEVIGKALEVGPRERTVHASLLGNRGVLERDQGKLDLAEADYRAALELAPQLAMVWSNLAELCFATGRAEEGLALNQRARDLAPRDPFFASNWLYRLHFLPGWDAPAIHRELIEWRTRFADSWQRQPHSNDRNPGRRLRIGYVSPHFYEQAESYFTVPLLEHHDHSAYEIHCFSSVSRPDEVTARLRRCADVWHDVRDQDDEALASRIRQERIDILVDLTMHMGDNRALLFARKPAPVQVCWLAYPGGTGLGTMDYRLTDSFMDPIDSDTSCYLEQSIRLPDCWVVYNPLIDLPPRPPEQSGGITFGSLNNPMKLNEPLLRLWGRVLQEVAGARLVLLVPSLEHRRRIGQLMASLGIGPERVGFVGQTNRKDYLRSYDQIDIALDPLPYNGITTTCDALYMGVPVLTLAGATAAGRAGAGMLTTVGMSEFVAHNPEEFVRKAAELAGDLPRLVLVRRELRQRLIASPLMEAPRFARHFEAALREMWRRWCGGA